MSLFATLKCTRTLSKLYIRLSPATVCSPVLRTAFPPSAFSTLFIRDFSLQKHTGGS